MGKIRAFAKHVKWSDEESAIIKEKYATSSRNEMLECLPSRTIVQIENKAHRLGIKRIKKKPTMTEAERREAKRIGMAKRRELDPDGMRDYQRRFHFKNHEANKAKMRGYSSRRFFWRKAMKLRGDDRATYKDLASIWRSQRGMCALTGRKLDRTAEPDHIVPKAKGGNDCKSNIRWVCREANRMKRDMMDVSFIALCNDVTRHIGQRINDSH